MAKPMYPKPFSCPVCETPAPVDFFSLCVPTNSGRLLYSREEALNAAKGQINLCFCVQCGHVCNRSYDYNLLSFEKGYDVSLAHSPLFRSFAMETAKRLIERYKLSNKTVVEIGCGKGDFLGFLCESGSNTGYGFDPSIDQRSTQEAGLGQVYLVPGYYPGEHSSLSPDMICALGVLDCIPRPLEFLASIRSTIGETKPVLYFEVFNAERALSSHSNWSVHYESCNYWSAQSLTYVFQQAGFEVLDIGQCYGDGEYLYIEAVPSSAAPRPSRQNIALNAELSGLASYHAKVTELWMSRLVAQFNQGGRVAVWGTGGKGTTFLSLFPAELIGCVVDINPNRQDTYIPCSGHLIESPDKLRAYQPTLIIMTNPLYAAEISDEVRSLGLSCELTAI